MAQSREIRIDQIFKGISPSQYFGAEGTYNGSTAVDSDLPIVSSDVRASGFPVPVGYTDFSGANVNDEVVSIVNNPKNTLTYVALRNGKVISYSSSLASETLVGTVTGSHIDYATYYNNYVYFFGTGASKDDVSRYGPLNNSPALTNGVWTGSTLGTQTALTNTTYPSLRSIKLPNHVAFSHGDGSLYFLDFKDGQGLVHRINTKKVTDEGDTNGTTVVSAYNALDLPFGFYPTSITNFSTSLLITGIYTIDDTVNQGRSAFVLWDPTDTESFYLGPVFLPDPLCTASLNVNGVVHLWTGNAKNGTRLSRYLGGESVQEIEYLEESMPPFAGAVDALGSRVVWGGYQTYPNTGAVVWAHGSKNAKMPQGLHCIAKTASAGATPIITALRYVLQSSNITPQMVVAWNDADNSGIDKYSTSATLASEIRWMFNIGRDFEITKISIPLAGAVAANTSIVPSVLLDDASTTKTLTEINNTNNSSDRKVVFSGVDLKDFTGSNNFILKLAWTSTNPLPVALPIIIELDVYDDENTA